MVSLNDKVTYLLELIEKLLKQHEKHMNFLYKSVYKSFVSTLRALLAITPDKTLAGYGEKIALLHEAIFTAEYESKSDFTKAIEELISTWN